MPNPCGVSAPRARGGCCPALTHSYSRSAGLFAHEEFDVLVMNGDHNEGDIDKLNTWLSEAATNARPDIIVVSEYPTKHVQAFAADRYTTTRDQFGGSYGDHMLVAINEDFCSEVRSRRPRPLARLPIDYYQLNPCACACVLDRLTHQKHFNLLSRRK